MKHVITMLLITVPASLGGQSIASGLDLRTLVVSEPDFTFTRRQLEELYTGRTAAVLLTPTVLSAGAVGIAQAAGQHAAAG